MEERYIEEAAGRFALLGDPTRLRILRAVMEQDEAPVHQIALRAGASRFNTSAHLNRLALSGMVARRREGSSVYYRVGDDQLRAICAAMCGLCDSLRVRPTGSSC